MNPLTYWEQIIKMPDKADKFDLRLRIIKSVRTIGVKPTARLFDTTPKTVRKWLARFRQERTIDGFEKVVEGFGSTHKRIPVRAWSYNSDVETVHSTIESEFYDLECFESIKVFHRRVASYQAWYNLVRENSNKDYKTPLQIIKEIGPNIYPAVAKLPPLMLDWLGPDYITKDELFQRGYDVPCYPLKDRLAVLLPACVNVRFRSQRLLR
jgi:transposase-like protein